MLQVGLLALGGYLSYRAGKRKRYMTTREYFLASGAGLHWALLSLSDVSSYLDISGTAINTALLYALGVSGFYVRFCFFHGVLPPTNPFLAVSSLMTVHLLTLFWFCVLPLSWPK